MLSISSASAFAADKPEIFVQLGHSNKVSSVAFSPDGRYALSASDDKTIRLWDVSSGREIRTFTGHEGRVTAVVFSPDGRNVLSASAELTIKLWDVSTGETVRKFKRPSNYFISLAFSPDGQHALSGGFKTIKLWNVSTGEEVRTFSGHSDNATSLAFSPDGRSAVSGGADNTIKLWDVATGAEIRTFRGHMSNVGIGRVESVAFSPDGKYLLSGGYDKTLKLWNISTGREIRTMQGHSWAVNAVAFSPDGRVALSGGDTLKLWDISTGREIRQFKGFTSPVNTVAFPPDGKYVLSGSSDKTLTLWDVSTGKEKKSFTGHAFSVNSVAFSPDGKYVLSGSGDSTLKLWEIATGKAIRAFTGTRAVYAVAFSPDGRYALSGSNSVLFGGINTLKLWDISTGREIRQFAEVKALRSVAFSPDSRYALSGGMYTLKLWDISTGKEIRQFEEEGDVRAAAFSPDGRYVLSGSWRLQLWDVSTGKKIRSMNTGWMNSLSFSPDGRYALSGGGNHFELWNIATGTKIRQFTGLSDANSVTFSPDGRMALSGSEDGTTRFWDVANGNEFARCISFTDGEWIVITPEGYFNASPNGAKHLNVRVGNNVYGIDQFYAKFYRPELVQLALAGKEIPKGELITDIAAKKPAPNVQILSPVTNSSVDQDNVAVTLKITDSGGGIGSVNVYLNGAQVANDTRGVIVKGRASANERILSFTIPLIAGQNEIRAVAFNGENSMESNPALVNVISKAVMRKPNLYALVIGINTYRNKSISLTYAVPDAIAFAGTLQKVASPLFEKADIRTLITPEATTKEAITKAFEEVRQMVRPNDLFVFYDASHGMVDVVNGEEQYFLLTSNVRLLSSQHISEDALSHKDLVSLIGSIPAQKKLVILDTCNAGKGGKGIQIALLQQTRGLTDATAVKLLQRAVGSSVFSASADTQQALEGYKGHGLFTYVLLEGLQGKADFKKDGFITVRGLALHTEERVMTLSEEVFKRQQNPMIETGVYDFPIGKVR